MSYLDILPIGPPSGVEVTVPEVVPGDVEFARGVDVHDIGATVAPDAQHERVEFVDVQVLKQNVKWGLGYGFCSGPQMIFKYPHAILLWVFNFLLKSKCGVPS